MANLVALLTPNFDGRVWYEKDAANSRLTIYGIPRESASAPRDSALPEVSYRLTANRFDHAKWTNYADDESGEGFVIEEKK
jgi:hypothetical protein